jgi:hypothetical protein
MRHRKLWILAALAFVAAAAGWALLKAESAGREMTAAADKFLGSLDAEQRGKATMPMESPQRVDWHFIPKATRKGLQIREMNPEQRKAAHALLRAALSEAGYDKATKIMELENLLKELEKAKTGTPLRDAERYYFTVFGKPSAEERWGVSIEGHHLSLNFVVEKGAVVSSTPAVFAVNPAVVKNEIPGLLPVGTRVLAKEETLAFDLVNSLNDEQRKVAVIAEKAPAEVREPGSAQPPQQAPAGIAAGKLAPDQAKILKSLIAEYAAAMPEEVAQSRLAAIEDAGFEKVHFAWAGPPKPGVGHYYRVQGPTFLIEFVNTQPDAAGNPANHIHSLWRDMRGDFGIALAK